MPQHDTGNHSVFHFAFSEGLWPPLRGGVGGVLAGSWSACWRGLGSRFGFVGVTCDWR